MSLLIAMCLFSLSMSFSPGPVNLIVLSTGASHGFQKALPITSGATIGFTLLLLLTGLGLENFAARSEAFFDILAYGGTGFICYIGFKILTSDTKLVTTAEKPASFMTGFIMQWVNPKAWGACLAGISAFNAVHSLSILATFVSIYFVVCYVSIAAWAMMGAKVSHLLQTPRNLKIFNTVMGISLIFVALYLLAMHLDYDSWGDKFSL